MKLKYFLLAIYLAVTASNIEIIADAAEADYVMQQSLTAESVPADILAESLARLPVVQRADLDAIGQDAFDTYVRPGTGYETGLRGPIGMWMHSPEVAKAMFNVRRRVRYGSAIDQRLTELTIISTAREIDSQYIYTAHEPAARDAGLEQEIIDIVRFQVPLDQVVETDGLGEREKAIIQFAREVINEEKVGSETFAKAIELFGNEGVMDLTGLIGYYDFVSMTVRAFDVQRPIGNELLLPIRVGEAGNE
ncbi:MAG: hypothetical protein V3R59_03915 [Gammaproteobacteria bacterium]